MTNNECLVDVYNASMIVKGKQIKLSFEEKLGCCRVTIAENVTIPPCSELITMCNVKPPVFEKVQLFGIVEPSDRFLESDRGLVARTLIKGNKVAPVILMNPS